MTKLCFSFVVISYFTCGFAGFVFSPLSAPGATKPPEDAVRLRGHAMAKELREALPTSIAPLKQIEPALTQTKEDEKEKKSRSELLAAASLFNSASSENTEEQQAAEDALREAMSSPSLVGQPDRSLPDSSPSACLPDFAKCPKEWNKKGTMCVAGGTYSGQCKAEVDLTEMSVEQKIAFASFCSATFPCQEGCAQDFQQTCPSLWREIGPGVCSAPLQYQGVCASRLDVTSMSQEDKYTWSVRCGARWPCSATRKHDYNEICPTGWSLQLGKVCAAPSNYEGPCERLAYMSGVTNADKKAFEATCHVDWPEADGECVHDYSAECPFGWYSGSGECTAPLTHRRCSNRKTFFAMTPAAKADWAQNCAVRFPCKDRSKCSKVYSTGCPADWYAFNGGASCAAPTSYAGPCVPVLHGLLRLSATEKVILEEKCDFQWPCSGEVDMISLREKGEGGAPRTANDPAEYATAVGPIDSLSGAVKKAR